MHAYVEYIFDRGELVWRRERGRLRGLVYVWVGACAGEKRVRRCDDIQLYLLDV